MNLPCKSFYKVLSYCKCLYGRELLFKKVKLWYFTLLLAPETLITATVSTLVQTRHFCRTAIVLRLILVQHLCLNLFSPCGSIIMDGILSDTICECLPSNSSSFSRSSYKQGVCEWSNPLNGPKTRPENSMNIFIFLLKLNVYFYCTIRLDWEILDVYVFELLFFCSSSSSNYLFAM